MHSLSRRDLRFCLEIAPGRNARLELVLQQKNAGKQEGAGVCVWGEGAQVVQNRSFSPVWKQRKMTTIVIFIVIAALKYPFPSRSSCVRADPFTFPGETGRDC